MQRRDELYLADIVDAAAARVSAETRALDPNIPWHQARGMSNLLIHAYFSVDWDIVWNTATDAVPKLAAQVARMLESGEPLSYPRVTASPWSWRVHCRPS
jgi:hypothetical protein